MYSMKIFISLLCTLFFAVLGSSSTQAQTPYTVWNSSPGTTVSVCLQINCGGILSLLAPCSVSLATGVGQTWTVPVGCAPVAVRVNGTLYPIQAPGVCLPLAPPNPPNRICFGLNGADISN